MTRRQSAVLVTSLVLAVLCSLVLTYLWVDRSISLGYSDDSIKALTASRHNLVELLKREWTGLSILEVTQKLNEYAKSSPDGSVHIKVETEGSPPIVRLDDIEFEFANGRLKAVR